MQADAAQGVRAWGNLLAAGECRQKLANVQANRARQGASPDLMDLDDNSSASANNMAPLQKFLQCRKR